MINRLLHGIFTLTWYQDSNHIIPEYAIFDVIKGVSADTGEIWKMPSIDTYGFNLYYEKRFDTVRIKSDHLKG